jgi:hypothetical protein
MHATLRYYAGAGAKELAVLLGKRSAEVETTMRQTPKFVGYTLIKLPEGCVSITVCLDKAGTEQSAKIAGAWIKEHAGGLKVSPPNISEGAVIVHAR